MSSNHRLYVSFPPYIHKGKTVSGIYRNYLIALLPAIFASLYYFRAGALCVLVISVVVSVLTEYLLQKVLKREIQVSDCHAILNGLILAFLLPPSSPWWMVTVGAFCSIAIGKQIFGELGNNPFNPPLIGWVMLRLSWPDKVSNWIEPVGGWVADPVLQIFKIDGIEAIHDLEFNILNLFLGRQAGGLGTICALALLVGAIYLLGRRVISWHIPVSYLLTVFLFSLILYLSSRETQISPIYHLICGGTLLGAIFIATDPVSSPVTRWGKLAFGLICGVIVMVIRTWGKYPDGTVFAILLANTSTPLLNRLRPRSYGKGGKGA